MDRRLRNLDERLKVIEREREGELTLLRREIRKNKDRLNKLHGTCGISPDAEGCDESSNQQGGKRRKTRRKRRKRRKRTFKKRKSRKRIRKKKRSTKKH